MDSLDWNRSVSAGANGNGPFGTTVIRGNVFLRYISFAPSSSSGAYLVCEGNNIVESIVVNRVLRALIQGNVVSGKDVDGNFSAGTVVRDASEGGVIANNFIFNGSGTSLTLGGIDIEGTSTRMVIQGNLIDGASSSSSVVNGIRIASFGGNSPSRIQISGNYFGSPGGTMSNCVDVSALTSTSKATNLIFIDPLQANKEGVVSFISDTSKVYTSTPAWT